MNSLRSHRHFSHPSTEEKFICEICAIGFKTQGLLRRHARIAHKRPNNSKPKKKFKCDICLKFYCSQGSLYTHKITHQTGQFKCTLCDHISRNPIALKSHKKNVHVEAKFKCHLCDKSFKFAPALKVSIEIQIIIHNNNSAP